MKTRFATKSYKDMIKGGIKIYSGEVPILTWFSGSYQDRPVEWYQDPDNFSETVWVTYLDSNPVECLEVTLTDISNPVIER